MTVRRWVEIPVPDLHIAAWLDDPTCPSQRIRNTARAIKLSGDRDEYAFPTAADTLEEIAAVVATNEERQAEQVARIAELEAVLTEWVEKGAYRGGDSGYKKDLLKRSSDLLGGAK
jgi:hypothetical protein